VVDPKGSRCPLCVVVLIELALGVFDLGVELLEYSYFFGHELAQHFIGHARRVVDLFDVVDVVVVGLGSGGFGSEVCAAYGPNA